MEMKADERFYTPRSSARRGYSSGSEDERFVSPRTSARSVSSDDNEFGTARESIAAAHDPSCQAVHHHHTAGGNDDYFKRAMGKPRLSATEFKHSLPTHEEYEYKTNGGSSRGKCVDHNGIAGLGRTGSAKMAPSGLELRSAQLVDTPPVVPENDIFSAARHNRIDSVTYMLDQGISVNSRDAHGNTILSISCQNGLKRMAKLALRRGANINSQNNRGNTALHFCFAYGYGDTLGEYLLSKGADETLANDDGLVGFHGIDPRSPRK